MHSVSVALGSRSYDILIEPGLLQRAGELIAKQLGNRRLAIVTDSNVAPLHLGTLVESLEKAGLTAQEIIVPAGEASKCLTMVEEVCEQMVAARHDRGSAVLALGGGVIGDLAGFVAAIYFRGIPFVQIPTTVMAQVDSAVGGKTGVNTRKAKNLLGSFHQPSLVLADIETLLTLPDRALFEGFAEVIKHGIIRDREFFHSLTPIRSQLDAIRSRQAAPDALTAVIKRNVEIKAAVVAEDEHETKDIRALLNFGHTIGHAIEAVAGYGQLLHGEAISLGMVAAANLSVSHAGLPEPERAGIVEMLQRYNLPVKPEHPLDTPAILDTLMSDKKFKAGSIRFVLSSRIGEAFVSKDVALKDIEAALASSF